MSRRWASSSSSSVIVRLFFLAAWRNIFSSAMSPRLDLRSSGVTSAGLISFRASRTSFQVRISLLMRAAMPSLETGAAAGSATGLDASCALDVTGGVGAIWFSRAGVLLLQPAARIRRAVRIRRDMNPHHTAIPRSLSRSAPGRPISVIRTYAGNDRRVSQLSADRMRPEPQHDPGLRPRSALLRGPPYPAGHPGLHVRPHGGEPPSRLEHRPRLGRPALLPEVPREGGPRALRPGPEEAPPAAASARRGPGQGPDRDGYGGPAFLARPGAPGAALRFRPPRERDLDAPARRPQPGRRLLTVPGQGRQGADRADREAGDPRPAGVSLGRARRDPLRLRLRELEGRPPGPGIDLEDRPETRPPCRRAGPRLPPRAPTLLRDASGRRGRRSALRPGDARPFQDLDDADLHPGRPQAPARGAPEISPPGLGSRCSSAPARGGLFPPDCSESPHVIRMVRGRSRSCAACSRGSRTTGGRAMKVEVAVRGMHCAGCVRTIEKAARSLPGVGDA